MAVELASLTAHAGVEPQSRRGDRAPLRHLAALRNLFGVEFGLVDAANGDVIHRPAADGRLDWLVLGELCRQVAHRRLPEIIAEENDHRVLAVPLPHDGDSGLVAVGALDVARGRLPVGDDALHLAAASPAALVALARLFVEKIEGEQRTKRLEKEVESLSLHLSSTYEEISLLYRLTQNLKLSSKDEELAHLALDWLGDVLPVETLAIQLTPLGEAGDLPTDARRQPLLITHGRALLPGDRFSELVSKLGSELGTRPLIVNPPATDSADWQFPEIRQLILVPLCEGTHTFGWMAACNHLQGEELGTVEASLMGSVAAILGIHSGNTELYRQQAEFLANVVRALTSAIDAKDPYTCGHSDRVARVAVRLATELGCSSDDVNTIYMAGLLHDIGKIGIDDTVLRKPGKLTEAEYEHIKKHAEIGHRILIDLKQLDQVLPVVLHHHEQWDGKGYPHGLAGSNIPQLARIVAVADAFDAMGSDRPYRKGMPEDRLDGILLEGAGKQWDADVVEAFFRAREDIRDICERERRPVALDGQQWL